MDDTGERRSKRQKRESSYKAKAFEKFKELKSGKRNKYEEEEIDNVYEVVDEKEYVNKVLSRQDDYWIVDDDGSGYVEDGRDIFDDDLDMEAIQAASTSKSGKGVKRKKKQISENAGKGNLHYLISNMPSSKKKEVETVGNDEILSELLGEVDESDASITPINRKHKSSTVKRSTPKFSVFSAKKAANDDIKSFKSHYTKSSTSLNVSPIIDPSARLSILKQTPNQDTHLGEISIIPADSKNQSNERTELTVPPTSGESNQTAESPVTEIDGTIFDIGDDFSSDDDYDMSQIDQLAASQCEDVNISQVEDFQSELMDHFHQMCEGSNLDETLTPDDEVEKGVGVFRFFWWDAFEDASRQPGVVFLFGKTYSEFTKSYVSCCVAVRNIERKLYFLPKSENVTTQEVYLEICENIMKERQIKQFKARPVTKKYVFDPTIPTESEYIEVRYSAKDPGISSTTEGKTFSKIFGTESSYLEIFLLERKIKGPCWLDISNAVEITNTVTWCHMEMDCLKVSNVSITKSEKPIAPPPLVVSVINLQCAINPKNGSNEIVMISCISNLKYSVEKLISEGPLGNHFCIVAAPDGVRFPRNFHQVSSSYKATKLRKVDTEKALLNVFIIEFAKLDPDVVVGHDLVGHQINVLSERLAHFRNRNFSAFGRIKRNEALRYKLEKELFTGRLVADIKISAKELIKSRSYDLDTLCQTVLKLTNERIEIEPEEIPKLFASTSDIMKLISMNMKDSLYILMIFYHLNIVPLALQITNIAGNVMSRTLLGGRSERNEFLLMHAFSDKNFIVPDKMFKKRGNTQNTQTKKKPAYSGGLVLEPKIGFYDKLIILMDFNSLYPSIIQEYNICFTTVPVGLNENNMLVPDSQLQPGILPTEIRKLVESRREVKKLMNAPDLHRDLYQKYQIRQMALKLTANSMYGCLGFANSRFYAKNLAALITHKGREILTNTRDIVEKMNYNVIYGDTDSLMINTNIVDYDQVFKIGHKIKQEINKLYKQVELDIDGVFKYLLLLKKKKYAAVTMTKGKDGRIKLETEYKGLDIVRRDWSKLSAEAGKFILNQILSAQSGDDRVSNIREHLCKLKDDLENNRVPLTLLIITKQLTKHPKLYSETKTLPHVQVALRYNKSQGHLRAGDTVPYVICNDGTTNSAMQRAYHPDELKASDALTIDVKYYLEQQIYPVVLRICEPIDGIDRFQIAECLGMDTTTFKIRKSGIPSIESGENFLNPEVKFRNVDPFVFKCISCDFVISVNLENNVSFMDRCGNPECKIRPVEYPRYIQNQLICTMKDYVKKYHSYAMMCEDPMCPNETTCVPTRFYGRLPVCTLCSSSVLIKIFSGHELHTQLSYFEYLFDLNKIPDRPTLDETLEHEYRDLKGIVTAELDQSGYSVIDLREMFSGFIAGDQQETDLEQDLAYSEENDEYDSPDHLDSFII